ncbi:hypothetical protein [Pseudoteredinibacter isoporae]|uniref:Uncharacterized protein n=1 Tax=Pseudoteredinibacter isoporae TaxID=570281 RepID=A0A7X0MXB1_9GAMM|nr:hypothetical protein [Pseudoteredinibacter isoporae]MBB6523080.1 hypothetical protein [Pseudoteredinibacter isoporae]NHO88600.1 hypothetical protein [Pseudoteredinibacter isoporae]NIB22709.1 hypothetical protein [Pseudoteredinibacter isoporae]
MKISSSHFPNMQLPKMELGQTSPTSQTPIRVADIESVKVSLSDFSASQDALLEADKTLTRFAVFQGHNSGLLMPESEKTDRMQAQLDRIPGREAKSLVDSGLLDSEEFLDFAESLSDEELTNFAQAAAALETPPKLNNFFFASPAKQKTEAFMRSLSEMDAGVRREVLSKASELSQGVPLREPSPTYSARGVLAEGSAQANDIHNFVKTVNQLGGDSDKQAALLQGLGHYQADQQSGLLTIAAGGADMGLRLMDSLQVFSKDAQDATIDYLKGVSDKKSPFELTVTKATDPENWSGAVLGYDNHSSNVVEGMISDIVSISENYRFTDEQWQDMMEELGGLDATDQRAYIAITKGGLDTLLDGSPGKPEDVNQNAQLMDNLDRLRNSSIVRDVVFKSAVGEERVSDGQSYYAHKESSDSKRDQEAMVEFLVTDAWLNREDEARTLVIASKLEALGAEQRDEQVDTINGLVTEREPLAQSSDVQLQDDYEKVLQRSDVLRHSNDIPALNALEQTLDASLKDKFWATAPIMEGEVDEFVQTLSAIEGPQQAMILEYLDTLKAEAEEQGLADEVLRDTALDFLNDISRGLRGSINPDKDRP